jgi:hypothetical protein
MWRVLVLAACGFQAVAPPSFSEINLPYGDGGCSPGTDVPTSCRDPGAGTCLDLVDCLTLCVDDQACKQGCFTQVPNPKSRTLATNYIQCRDRALSGACSVPCQSDQSACEACLHVCSYDSQCNYVCPCGACAAEVAACFADR